MNRSMKGIVQGRTATVANGIIFIYFFLIQHVLGSGRLQVTLHSYVFDYQPRGGDASTVTPTQVANTTVTTGKVYNPQWELSSGLQDKRNGTVMTSEWPWTVKTQCSAPPQYRFLVCLDYADGYDPENPCSLERIQTGKIRIDKSPFSTSALGRETITFISILGFGEDGIFVLNPINVDFPRWRGPVRLSVHVRCCGDQDHFKGQCNEIVSTTIAATPNAFVTSTQTVLYTLNGRGSLMLSASATCDPTFFGPSCDIRCLVENPSVEHTFCNVTTGIKQCLKGWTGVDCQTDIDECQNVTCQNKGTCRNLPGTFNCLCPLGTKGLFCEQRVPVCYTRPCQNGGTCFDTSAGSLCMCQPGFDGHWCDEVVTQPSMPVAITTKLPDFNASTAHAIADGAIADRRRKVEQIDGWQNWYLAIIVGVLVTVAIVMALVFHRHRQKKQYQVNIGEISTPVAPTDLQTPPKPHHFNNAVYHTSDPSNIIHNNLGNDLPEDKSSGRDYCNVLYWRNLDSTVSSENDDTVALHETYSSHPIFMENPAFGDIVRVKNVNIIQENANVEKNEKEPRGETVRESLVAKKPMFPPTFSKNLVTAKENDKNVACASAEDNSLSNQEDSLYVVPRSNRASENVESLYDKSCKNDCFNAYEEVNLATAKKAIKPKPLPRSIYKVAGNNARQSEGQIKTPEDDEAVNVAVARVPVDEEGYCVPVTSGSQPVESDRESNVPEVVEGKLKELDQRLTVYVEYSPEMNRSSLRDTLQQSDADSVYSYPPNNRSSRSSDSGGGESSMYANMPSTGHFEAAVCEPTEDHDGYLMPAPGYHDNEPQDSTYANTSTLNSHGNLDNGGYVNYSELNS